MSEISDLLKANRAEAVWQKCCGFINLSPQQFMDIQYSLLLEQLGLLKRCRLGRRMLGDVFPDSVDEFRKNVPLTQYRDYSADLLSKRTDILPAQPVKWISGLGMYGEYSAKVIPVTRQCWEELEFIAAAAIIFAGILPMSTEQIRKQNDTESPFRLSIITAMKILQIQKVLVFAMIIINRCLNFRSWR